MNIVSKRTSRLLHFACSICAILLAILSFSEPAQAQCNGCSAVSIINCSSFSTKVSFVLCCNGNETLSQYIGAGVNCADMVPISMSPCTVESVNNFAPPLPSGVNYTWDPSTCTLYIY
jgi:hypothetical protein